MVERVTIRGGRYYRLLETNELFPSVTTVLSVIKKGFLPRWEAKLAVSKFRSRIDERLKQQGSISPQDLEVWANQAQNEPNVHLNAAGGFGTDAHTLFESLLTQKREDVQVAPQFEAVVHNFVAWRDGLNPPLEVVNNEMIVVSRSHGYAGAVDAICKLGDKLVVMDWKTSNSMHLEYALQVSAYAHAYSEMTGQKISEGWIVRFDKSTRKAPQVKVVADLKESFDAFLAAKKLWAFMDQPTSKHLN